MPIDIIKTPFLKRIDIKKRKQHFPMLKSKGKKRKKTEDFE